MAGYGVPRAVIPQESWARIVQRYHAGEKMCEIVETEGCSPKVLKRYITESGLERVKPLPETCKPHRISEALSADILRHYASGLTVKQVCKLVGYGHRIVCRVLKEAGVTRPPQRGKGITEAEVVRMLDARLRGQTTAEIGARFGINPHTVTSHTVCLMPVRRVTWIDLHLDEVADARRGYDPMARSRGSSMWEELHARFKPPYTVKSFCTQYGVARAKRLQLDIDRFYLSRSQRVLDLTTKGLSAQAIGEELGVAERTVVRIRSRDCRIDLRTMTEDRRALVEVALQIDIKRVARLCARSCSWGDINRRLGSPFECGAELEVAYNTRMDHAADLYG